MTMAKRKGTPQLLSPFWKPNPTHRELAEKEGLDLKVEAELFRAHAAANGRMLVNWDQGFCVWLRNEAKWRKARRPAPSPLSYRDEQAHYAAQEEAARSRRPSGESEEERVSRWIREHAAEARMKAQDIAAAHRAVLEQLTPARAEAWVNQSVRTWVKKEKL